MLRIEDFGNSTKIFVNTHLRSVAYGYSCTVLTAMLQGIQCVINLLNSVKMLGRIRLIRFIAISTLLCGLENSYHTTLIMEFVIVFRHHIFLIF